MSCASLQFDPEVQLDGGIDNQTNTTLVCGTGTLEFTYTLNKDDKLGIFEIENSGSCNIKVDVKYEVPASGTVVRQERDVSQFGIDKDAPSKTQAFKIPGYKQGAKLKFKITCEQAQGNLGCKFYYRFSAARKQKKPTITSVSLLDTPITVSSVTVGTGPGANQCLTQGKIVKTIVNSSKENLVLSFKAFSACSCNNFIAYSDRTPNKIPAKDPPNTPNAGASGKVKIPKGKTVNIMIRCDGGSQTNDPCDGEVKEYAFGQK